MAVTVSICKLNLRVACYGVRFLMRKLLALFFAACPLCSRLGLQGSINTTLEVLNRGKSDADTVSNLKELWPKLTTVERLVDEARVCMQIYFAST